MSQFDQVSVIKKANIYFDGKCVSHSVLFPDGTRKTLGVIFPGLLTFSTDAPETMEITAYRAGEQFKVPGASSFEIETIETLDYVCHFG